jgi:hypothetical protein
MRPMRFHLALMTGLLTGSFALAASPALAQNAAPVQPKAVVELFTSQGCSSCPPADSYAGELMRNPALVVLTFNVDYWDYLGWKDTLAHSSFSQRQRAYAKARGDGQVYTPQIVINGAAHAVGSERNQVARAIAATSLPVSLSIDETNKALSEVTIPAARTGGVATGSVWLVPISAQEKVEIGRGENRGKTITYPHVARGLIKLGDWRGETLRFTVSAETLASAKADGFAVLLHAEGGKIGKIIGAATSKNLHAPAT